MRNITTLFFLFGLGCGDKDTDTAAESDTDTDTDADTDTDTDTDADTDTDTSVTDLSVSAPASLTSREVGTYTVTATLADSSTVDVTADAGITVDDDAVFWVYTEGSIQPLGEGTAELTVDFGGATASASVAISVEAATTGDLVINELLADGTAEGDPNGDGSIDGVEDEFIELVNLSQVTVDLAGVSLVEETFPFLARHTFAKGTHLRAGEAIVVFGGGDVSGLSVDDASFVVADNDDPGTQYGLSLDNDGNRLKVLAADGKTVIASLAYGDVIGATISAVSDESLVRTPEGGTKDAYQPHTDASSESYSPGTQADGAAFGGPDSVY